MWRENKEKCQEGIIGELKKLRIKEIDIVTVCQWRKKKSKHNRQRRVYSKINKQKCEVQDRELKYIYSRKIKLKMRKEI